MLCEYGCGQIANYQFKNGKWCCSSNISGCKVFRYIKSNKLKGRIRTEEHCKKISMGRKGIQSWSKGKTGIYSEETLKKMRDKHIGKRYSLEVNKKKGRLGKENGSYGRKKSDIELDKIRKSLIKFYSTEKGKIIKEKVIKKNTGKTRTDETKKRISEKTKGRIPWNKGLKGKNIMSKERRELYRKLMLDGGAVKAIKGIKNPSTQEIILREYVKEIYPSCIFQFSVLNYSIDIAIQEYKVAIEYDGWYHFDCKDHIEYHSKRQKEIENLGWKFIRYSIFSPFPSKIEILEDLKQAGINVEATD